MAGRERGRDLIVIGGSAGSLEPLRKLVAGLPADLPASATDPPGLRVAPHDRSEREAKARAGSDLRGAARPALASGRRVRGGQPGTA